MTSLSRTGLRDPVRLSLTAGLAVALGIALVLAGRGLQPPSYSLDAVRKGGAPVPRVFLPRLPGGLADTGETVERKTAFLRTVLPLVLRTNEEIARDRQRLLGIISAHNARAPLPRHDRKWLEKLAQRYRLPKVDLPLLKRRVDIVPPSLPLAQAAIESAWGTSRFATAGNAIFGMWTYDESAGLVPRKRGASARHAVRSYKTLSDSVRGYMRTLNTHRAYREFREAREALRRQGSPPPGRLLVDGLRRYTPNPDYRNLVTTIMQSERLGDFDRAKLAPP